MIGVHNKNLGFFNHYLLVFILFTTTPGFCQQIVPLKKGGDYLDFANAEFLLTDSGIIIHHILKKSCKNHLKVSEFIPTPKLIGLTDKVQSFIPRKTKFLTIHGNISYDFLYRSNLDIPVSQQDFKQHTETIYLNILLKEKFPFKMAFILRQGNSSYFKNFANINFQFDHFGFYRKLQQDILSKLSKSLEELPAVKTLEKLIAEMEKKISTLKHSLENPATLQKIIEERERLYYRELQQNLSTDNSLTSASGYHALDRFKNLQALLKNKFDSAEERMNNIEPIFSQQFKREKSAFDSLSKQMQLLQNKADSAKNVVRKNMLMARQKIYKARNATELMETAAGYGVEAGMPGRINKKLAAVKNFSIGRSMVNYTELTAQNVIVTGLNVEYNPSFYTAFAAGKIDYRFRDFLTKSRRRNEQYLVLGRIGFGNPERNALILTVFKGKKQYGDYSLNDSITNHVNIVGYSIESIFRLNENTNWSVELAKSTKPITGYLQNHKQINSLWRFSDQTNLGVNIKAQTCLPGAGTKLSGFYRKTGENFQSFSLFSYNTGQTAWLARADQYFFHEKLTVTGMLRRNDFTNPFTDKTYSTSTIFKSIILHFKAPKYPSLTLGYYPGSQLYVVNKERIRENAYYILNGSAVYSYFYKGIGMNSSFVYNQYVNQATDTGFARYKGITWYAMQTVFFKKWQCQAGFVSNKQPELKYFTVESSLDYSFKQFFKLAAGAKYNKINGGSIYWGETIQLAADLKQLGRFQLQYEKSYLPTINQILHPVETGRISWYKYF